MNKNKLIHKSRTSFRFRIRNALLRSAWKFTLPVDCEGWEMLFRKQLQSKNRNCNHLIRVWRLPNAICFGDCEKHLNKTRNIKSPLTTYITVINTGFKIPRVAVWTERPALCSERNSESQNTLFFVLQVQMLYWGHVWD